jgi:putative nucleotidyltransferase with HDIG domain
MTQSSPEGATVLGAVASIEDGEIGSSVEPAAARVTRLDRARSVADGSRHHNEGHGRRLTRAFEALEAFPALAASRDRVLEVVRTERPSVGDVAAAVESDVALVITVLRIANRMAGDRAGRIATLPAAVEILTPSGVDALVSRSTTFDFFERTPVWDAAPERFRLHAVATQRAADRLARARGYADRDELLASTLLHDIGKLVLVHAYPGYPGQVHGDARTAEDRMHRERRELGVDHALVGGVLARRWGLPSRLAASIEAHHSDDPPIEAAYIRLADMLAHYVQGSHVDSGQLLRVTRMVGLETSELRQVLYELPYSSSSEPRRVEPSPLSAREEEVLRRLAEGKVYKQIALELSLSTSTVRTHLHNTYGKLGAVDRAQAVLLATSRGWL